MLPAIPLSRGSLSGPDAQTGPCGYIEPNTLCGSEIAGRDKTSRIDTYLL